MVPPTPGEDSHLSMASPTPTHGTSNTRDLPHGASDTHALSSSSVFCRTSPPTPEISLVPFRLWLDLIACSFGLRSLLPASLCLLSSTSGVGGSDSSNNEWDLSVSSSSSPSQLPPQPPSSIGPSSSIRDHLIFELQDMVRRLVRKESKEELMNCV